MFKNVKKLLPKRHAFAFYNEEIYVFKVSYYFIWKRVWGIREEMIGGLKRNETTPTYNICAA
jgi:hypothetical protein